MHRSETALTSPQISPLILADRLISMAQDADRAGFRETATRLLSLIDAVFDEAPQRSH